MDIKIKDNLDSFNDFKLLLPNTRRYKSEIFLTTLFNELGFLSPYTSMIKINYFDKEIDYLFYENLGKEFLERNKKIEGPIIRGDERFFFEDNVKFDKIVVARLENSNWIKNNEKNQIEISIEALTKSNQIFFEKYLVDKKKHNDSLIFNDKKINQLINDEKFKKFILLTRIIGAENLTTSNDIRLYYDPIFKKLEVIYNDGSVHFLDNPLRINYLNIDKFEFDLIDKLIFDLKKISIKEFHKNLILRGLDISEKDIKKNLDTLYKRINIIADHFNNNSFDEYKPKKIDNVKNFIENKILELNSIYSYSISDDEFKLCDSSNCIIKYLTINEIKKLLNQKYKFNKKDVVFLGYEKIKNNNLDFYNTKFWNQTKIGNTNIFYQKDVILNINEKEKKILINSGKSKKIVFYKGLLKDWKIEYFDKDKYSKDISNFENNSEEINGCLNFYDLNFDNLSINIENSNCEDGVNFVRSNGYIDNLNVLNSKSDAVDFDFSNIKINNLSITNANNDCIDFSYGDYEIEYAKLFFCNDKALSIGETSYFRAKNLDINNSNIALAVKDSSEAEISNLIVNSSIYCSVMYRKKTEFKGAKLKIDKQNCNNAINFIDKGNIYIANEF